jgi:ERCC4-related helicase
MQNVIKCFFISARGKFEYDAGADEARKKLDATLSDFRGGRLNCLVSTSVLEEGMDVKTCNLVVRFDRIQTYRSYVQSKGRARARPSSFVIMENAKNRSRSEIEVYREIEDDSINICHREHDGDLSGNSFY